MTPQELKNSILQLAFSGKLTAQLSSDVDVNKLIAKCEKDKQNTIREGKCRSEKFRGAIANHGYEIPSSWRVLYISDVALFQEGPGILAADFRASGVPLIRISGMRTQRVSLEGCNYLDPVMVENKWKHFRLDVGDVLISTSASMDKVCEVFEDCAGAIPYTGQIRFKMYGGISKEFFKWFVQSPLYISQISNYQVGSAIKHYGPTHLKRMTIPLPPLAEQKRIVAKIEELLPLIDRYEKAWSKLEDFHKRFPVDMQKSLLQMAIQGKLVEQRAEEGTAAELLRDILTQRRRDAEVGRSPRDRRVSARNGGRGATALPPIPDDEKPFDIPESWEWVRLSSVTDMLSGFAFKSTDFKANGKYRLLRGINLGVDDVRWKETVYVDYITERMAEYRLKSGDVLIGLDRPWISDGTRVAIFNDSKETYLVQRVLRLRETGLLTSAFIALLLRSSLLSNSIGDKTTGISVPHISPGQVGNLVIPLPPLAEQKRIVAKLEELLPLCERLK